MIFIVDASASDEDKANGIYRDLQKALDDAHSLSPAHSTVTIHAGQYGVITPHNHQTLQGKGGVRIEGLGIREGCNRTVGVDIVGMEIANLSTYNPTIIKGYDVTFTGCRFTVESSSGSEGDRCKRRNALLIEDGEVSMVACEMALQAHNVPNYVVMRLRGSCTLNLSGSSVVLHYRHVNRVTLFLKESSSPATRTELAREHVTVSGVQLALTSQSPDTKTAIALADLRGGRAHLLDSVIMRLQEGKGSVYATRDRGVPVYLNSVVIISSFKGWQLRPSRNWEGTIGGNLPQ